MIGSFVAFGQTVRFHGRTRYVVVWLNTLHPGVNHRRAGVYYGSSNVAHCQERAAGLRRLGHKALTIDRETGAIT